MHLSKTLGKILFALLCNLFFLSSEAQNGTTDLGIVSSAEANFKECSFDRDADAVIILDKGVAYFNEDFNLIIERHIRIKILKDKGISRGDIRIPFYSHENFETLKDIEASVITPDDKGGQSFHLLDNKNIYKKQVNKLYSLISFALPNVKVGSIITYKYTSVMKNYAGLTKWEFQSELPVLNSSFELSPIPNSEFTYSVYKSSRLPIQITPNNSAGKILFVMNNVPGLRDEVYSTSVQSYLQRVNFQFASYKDRYGKTEYTNTWKKLASELMEDNNFGKQVNKDLSNTPFMRTLSPSISSLNKLRAIYDYVKTNITWNDIYSKYSEEGVKTVLEKKKGNSGDINLLLVSLLRSAGIESYPLLVSERDHGAVDTTYSFLKQFNKAVAYAKVEGQTYILDGTDFNTPYHLVPADLLNTTGFIVDKKQHAFIYLKNLPHKQEEHIEISGVITTDGIFKGKAIVKEMAYAKLAKERRHQANINSYREAMLKPYSFLTVDSFTVEGYRNDSLALLQQVGFHYNLKKAGEYYLLNYNLFTGLNENPFITQNRFTDIDFGTKYSGIITGSFVLPPSLSTETLPANKKLVLPDHSMSVSRNIEQKNNQVIFTVSIEINREKFAALEYETVKTFFKQTVDLLNEPILLKSK
jgi:hypothetical protein